MCCWLTLLLDLVTVLACFLLRLVMVLAGFVSWWWYGVGLFLVFLVWCLLGTLLGSGMVLTRWFAWGRYGPFCIVWDCIAAFFCFVLVWCLLGCYFDSSWDMGFALFLCLVFAMVSACIFDWFTMPALFCIDWDVATLFLLGLGKVFACISSLLGLGKVLARCSLIWYGGWLCLCLVFAMVLAFLGD